MILGMAMERALRQIRDPVFLRVLFWGLLLTALLLALAVAAAAWGAGQGYVAKEGWLNAALAWLAGLATLWLGALLFVPLSAIAIGLFLDPVVDAVEAKYYADRRAGPRLGILRAGWLGAKLGVIVLIANIVVAPLYILTIWIPFFAIGLFYILNAYLLGWGFYDLVATRHMSGARYRDFRKSLRGELLLFGLLITALYFVPLLNLALPVLGTAMMVHIVHAKLPTP
jgi:uncharacterized protein involved in cysteine biosynthesis